MYVIPLPAIVKSFNQHVAPHAISCFRDPLKFASTLAQHLAYLPATAIRGDLQENAKPALHSTASPRRKYQTKSECSNFTRSTLQSFEN